MRLIHRALINHKPASPIVYATMVSIWWLSAASLRATSGITYIQGNYSTPQSSQSTVSVTFTGAQSSGDLNVIVVGWNDSTAVVNSVTDSRGNTYARAVGPTIVSGSLSQSIYYAKNIKPAAAGANSVTVAFATAAAFPDIRILEYSGADPNSPVDVTTAASGNSTGSSTASATTTYTTDLLFGANTVTTGTTGPGSGATQRLLTSPDGDIAEDQLVAAAGIYSATAPLNSPGAWVMQMVAFKAAGSTVSGACDLNQDNTVNVLDVQLATDMDLGSMQCTVNIGGVNVCDVAFVNAVTTAAMGRGCITPVLVAAPSSINFGNVVTGNTGTQNASLTNTGTGSLTVSNAAINGAGLSLSGLTLPLTLSSGQSAPFNVTFAPTSAGNVTGSIVFTSSGALNSPVSEAVTGTGVTSSSHSVSLSWTPSTSSNVVTYNIYRITSTSTTAPATPYPSLGSISATTCSATNCAYTDTAVQAGQSYWYYATSVDSNKNESAPSNTAQAVVPTP